MTQGGNGEASSSPTSSSNRAGGVCDAVVVQDQQPVGPMRLPISRPDDFIDHFNRVYEGLGMTLTPVVDDEDESPLQSNPEGETRSRRESGN